MKEEKKLLWKLTNELEQAKSKNNCYAVKKNPSGFYD